MKENEFSMNAASQLPLILMIDDDKFYLNELSFTVEGKAKYKCFLGPNDFEKNVQPEDISLAKLIIVDYNFGKQLGTAISRQMSEYIRNMLGFKGKLVLCTVLGPYLKGNDEVKQAFDYVLAKQDLNWDVISKLI